MNINTKDLPSKGLFGERLVEIKPVVNGDISRHANLPSSTTAQRLYKDLQIYIKSISDWEELCCYDYSALVFLKKIYTVSDGTAKETISLRCPVCENKIRIIADLTQSIDFPELSDELMKISAILLGGEKINKAFASMKQFDECLELMSKYDETLDEPEIMMRASFGFWANPTRLSSLIYSATKDELSLVHAISQLCSGRARYIEPIQCGRCKEVITVARSDFFATDTFQDVLLNFPVPKEKIILS